MLPMGTMSFVERSRRWILAVRRRLQFHGAAVQTPNEAFDWVALLCLSSGVVLRNEAKVDVARRKWAASRGSWGKTR